MDVFDAVWEQAKRSGDQKRLVQAGTLNLEATRRSEEIRAVREHRAAWRAFTRKGGRNGALVTLDMHPLEVEACKLLCPDLEHADWQAKKRGWQWILKQPYGKEFAPGDFEKTRF